jgi:hypothetical protein
VVVGQNIMETAILLRSNAGKVYASTRHGLLEIDPATSDVRTVFGNEFAYSSSGAFGSLFYAPEQILFSGDTAYAPALDDEYSKAARIALQPTTTAVDVIVPSTAMYGANFRGMTADATRSWWFYWVGSSESIDVFSQLHRQGSTNKKLFTLAGSDIASGIAGDNLYMLTEGSRRRLYRYQYSMDRLTVVDDRSPWSASIVGVMPLVPTAEGVYWAHGGTILYAANSGGAVRTVAGVTGSVKKLAFDGSNLWAVHNIDSTSVPSGTFVYVSRIDPSSGLSTPIIQRDADTLSIYGMAASADGPIFWVENNLQGPGAKLYELSTAGGPRLIHTTDRIGGRAGLHDTVAMNGVLYVSFEDFMLAYDYANDRSEYFAPATGNHWLAAASGTLYFSNGINGGIGRLATDRPRNKAAVLNPGNVVEASWSRTEYLADGFLYRTATAGAAPVWRMSRSRLDGTAFSELAQSTGELRDPVVSGGRLYFLCENSCGAAGWTLASMSLAGGAIRLEKDLDLNKPHLFEYAGHTYVTGSLSRANASVSALDLASGAMTALVEQLPFEEVVLTFSDQWLTWGGFAVNPDGSPTMGIGRHRWIDWNRIGTVQLLESGSGAGSNIESLNPFSIHSLNGQLYYWIDGSIVRVAE